ncbi:hypothetical protein [Modestobacter sp. SYSU DS0657]
MSATGRSPDGHVVHVVLHAVHGRVHGRVHELEVFDAEAGEGVAVDPAALTGLTHPRVGEPGPAATSCPGS